MQRGRRGRRRRAAAHHDEFERLWTARQARAVLDGKYDDGDPLDDVEYRLVRQASDERGPGKGHCAGVRRRRRRRRTIAGSLSMMPAGLSASDSSMKHMTESKMIVIMKMDRYLARGLYEGSSNVRKILLRRDVVSDFEFAFISSVLVDDLRLTSPAAGASLLGPASAGGFPPSAVLLLSPPSATFIPRDLRKRRQLNRRSAPACE